MRKNKVIFQILIALIINNTVLVAQDNNFNKSIINDAIIFEEKNEIVAIEAEFFHQQTSTDIRQWYRTSKNELAKVGRDDDEQHSDKASNNTYLEILPDTRVTHADKLIHGENFSNEAGKMAILHYKVNFSSPGRYFIWVRAFSTGGEDNGLHVGINNIWPESGQRMQWCKGKNKWTWESKQRTKEVHCGIPHAIYLDIDKAGVHTVQFSMREDGFEFDKFILTKDINYVPIEKGPETALKQGKLTNQKSYFKKVSNALSENKYIAAQEFPIEGTNFYKNGKNWLAINPEKHKKAQTSKIFNFESGTYDIVFVGVGENDGQSEYEILINNNKIRSYAPPLSKNLFEEGKLFNLLLENINIKNGDKITITAQVDSDDIEWTRGRWAGIIFAPLGRGKEIQEASSSFTQD